MRTNVMSAVNCPDQYNLETQKMVHTSVPKDAISLEHLDQPSELSVCIKILKTESS